MMRNDMSSWWIDEPLVLGSSNPTTEQLKMLYEEGFRNIISLLDEGEQSPNYEVEEVEAMGYERYSIPLRDFSAPRLDDLKTFLNVMDQAVGQGKVVVHCYAGIGRTGTMAVAYWMDKGLSVNEAMRKVRKSNPSVMPNDEQENSLYELGVFLASQPV
jgi:protein-tyrosine phosphatase